MKKKSPSFRLTRNWMFSYICILLLPIFLCLIYGVHTYNSVKEQHLTSLQQLITQKSLDTDNYLSDTFGYFNTFYLDEDVQKLQARSLDSHTPADRIYFKNLINKIAEICHIQGKLNDIIIYFPNIQTLVDKSTNITCELNAEIKSHIISHTALESLITGLEENPMPHTAYYSEEYILYIAKKLHTNRKGESSSYIIFKIDAQTLLEHLGTDMENTRTLIVSTELSSMLQTEPATLITSDRKSLQKNITEAAHSKIPILFSESNSDYYLCAAPSNKLEDFFFVYIAEQNAYDHAMTNIISFFIVIMLISLALGFLMINYFIKRNYKPVKEIIHQIDTSALSDTFTNEYSIILHTLKNNSSELKRQQLILANHYLQKMLIGEITFKESTSNHMEFLPAIKETGLYVSLIKLDDCPDENPDLFFFIVKNIMTELLHEYPCTVQYCSFPSAFMIAVIISSDDSTESFSEFLFNQYKFLHTYISEHSDLSITIGICDYWQQKEHIHKAYTYALNALEYTCFYKCEPVFLYSKLPSSENEAVTDIYNTKAIIQMTNLDTADSLIQYFNTLYPSHTTIFDNGRNLMHYYYQLCSELQIFLNTKYPANGLNAPELSKDKFLKLKPTEAAELTKSFFLEAREFIYSNKNNHMLLLVQQVRSYIDNNYFDVNMNQTTIADYFHITPAYLSQKFKDEYNISMIQYLYSVRIQESLKLLREKKLKVSEIALIVGFSNTNSFIRVFKQAMGISPGKYTENI